MVDNSGGGGGAEKGGEGGGVTVKGGGGEVAVSAGYSGRGGCGGGSGSSRGAVEVWGVTGTAPGHSETRLTDGSQQALKTHTRQSFSSREHPPTYFSSSLPCSPPRLPSLFSTPFPPCLPSTPSLLPVAPV